MTESAKVPAVGIDLGTTFSAVAILDDAGRPRTIQNAEGTLTTPSAVFLDRSGPIVGAEAIEAGMNEPERLALFAKRDVGEAAFRDKVLGHSLPPEVLQALVLKKLKEDAELAIGPFTKAVVTVPAFFNEPCRKATQDAGRLAGLDVIDIINEPTAAAITYGVGQGFLSAEGESRGLERVLVYDLGGGTFDVTVMEIEGRNFNTLATAGDVYLGGVDWDRRIVDFIAEAFVKEHGVDPRQDPFGEQELLQKANQVKHALTQRKSFIIGFNFDGMRLRTELSQAAYAKMSEDLVERTLLTTRIALDDAKLDFKQLTRLLLVGGSTRMPMIQSELEHLSGLKVDRSLSPDEAICHGAAIYAGVRLNHDASSFTGVSVTNVNSNDLGVLAIDPETNQPRRKIMIPRNSSLPASKSVRFRTHKPNQPNVKIQVVEGGDDAGTNATIVGNCYVDPLPPDTPKGTDVLVRFDYAQDGRLTVGASLPELDCQATTQLDRGQGLSEEVFEEWTQRIAKGLDDFGTNPETSPDTDKTSDVPIESFPADLSEGDQTVDKAAAPFIVTAAVAMTEDPKTPEPKKLKRSKPKVADDNGPVKINANSVKNMNPSETNSASEDEPDSEITPDDLPEKNSAFDFNIDTSDPKSRRRGKSK